MRSKRIKAAFKVVCFAYFAYFATGKIGGMSPRWARAEVVRVLEEAGEPMGPREVADALGADYNATRQRLYQMGRVGEVEVVGRGRYTTPNNPNNRPGQADPDVRDAEASPNNRESREALLDGDSEQDVRAVRAVRGDYDRPAEERMARSQPSTETTA